jgi:putative endonuclease
VSPARRSVGLAGEAAAASWYEARGGVVLARNWRCREGELDLVVRVPGGTVVFCEVKARSSLAFGSGFEAVTPAKQAQVRSVARRWLAASGRPGGPVRFDVASVLAGEVEVVEDAF